MALNYNPKDAESCWPEGDYSAVLAKVTDSVSKKTNQPMEVWEITCYHADGREQTITEYVTAAVTFKIKQLAIALGRRGEFEAGNFHAESHIGANFVAGLIVESQDGYDDKNKVGKFKAIPRSPVGASPAPTERTVANMAHGRAMEVRNRTKPSKMPTNGEPFKDDDIPF